MKTQSAFPNIDPRVHAVGTSMLRGMNAKFLRRMADDLYLIHADDEPVAVLIGYSQYLRLMQELRAAEIGVDAP